MDQSWFESCAARAEPCQPAVCKVKMCSLKGTDVFFVRAERRCCAAVRVCVCVWTFVCGTMKEKLASCTDTQNATRC